MSCRIGVRLLIGRGAEVDLKGRRGQTAVHVVVERGVSKQILGVLVERTADINAINDANKTPLHLLVGKISYTLEKIVAYDSVSSWRALSRLTVDCYGLCLRLALTRSTVSTTTSTFASCSVLCILC